MVAIYALLSLLVLVASVFVVFQSIPLAIYMSIVAVMFMLFQFRSDYVIDRE